MNACGMLTWSVVFKWVGGQDFINRHGSPMLTVNGIIANNRDVAVQLAQEMLHVQFDWSVDHVRRMNS